MGNTIKKEDIKRFSEGILEIMSDREIDSLENLENNFGEYPTRKFGEKVIIETRPSNANTRAHTISYTLEGLGIPIEIRINPELDYSLIILKKSGELVKGYESFDSDYFGNSIQSRRMKPGTIEVILSELRNLSKLKGS